MCSSFGRSPSDKGAARVTAKGIIAAQLGVDQFELDEDDPEIAKKIDEIAFIEWRTKSKNFSFKRIVREKEKGSDKDSCPLMQKNPNECQGEFCRHKQHIRGQHKNLTIHINNYCFNQFHGCTGIQEGSVSSTTYSSLKEKWEEQNPNSKKSDEAKQVDIDDFIYREMAAKGIPFVPVHYKSKSTWNRSYATDDQKLRDKWYKTAPHECPFFMGSIVRVGFKIRCKYGAECGLALKLDKENVHIVRQVRMPKKTLEVDAASSAYTEIDEDFFNESGNSSNEIVGVDAPAASNTITRLFGNAPAEIVVAHNVLYPAREKPKAMPTQSAPLARSASYVPAEEIDTAGDPKRKRSASDFEDDDEDHSPKRRKAQSDDDDE
jgi:hypothetical protein